MSFYVSSVSDHSASLPLFGASGSGLDTSQLGCTSSTKTLHSRMGKRINRYLSKSSRDPQLRSKLESTRQSHDVFRINLRFQPSQPWQIFPIDIDERCPGIHVVSVQSRCVIGEQPLLPCDNCEAIRRFFGSCNEYIVVESVLPIEVYNEWVGGLAQSPNRWGRPR